MYFLSLKEQILPLGGWIELDIPSSSEVIDDICDALRPWTSQGKRLFAFIIILASFCSSFL